MSDRSSAENDLPGDRPITLSDIGKRLDALHDIALNGLRETAELKKAVEAYMKKVDDLQVRLLTRPCIAEGENGDGECHADF